MHLRDLFIQIREAEIGLELYLGAKIPARSLTGLRNIYTIIRGQSTPTR